MIIREAKVTDIAQIQTVRNSVKENMLSDPGLVTDKDCEEYISVRGKGWVCELGGNIVGFSIVGLKENNVWALFVRPGFDKQGIGRRLHDIMLDWYFAHTPDNLWLSTAPHTRAAEFYKRSGWTEVGTYGKGELKFEMTFTDWQRIKRR